MDRFPGLVPAPKAVGRYAIPIVYAFPRERAPMRSDAEVPRNIPTKV